MVVREGSVASVSNFVELLETKQSSLYPKIDGFEPIKLQMI